MAKLGILLDTRNKKSDSHPVVIRLSHKSKWKYLPTGFKVKLNEWNKEKSLIKKPYPNSVRANAKIQKLYSIASDVLSDHNAVMKNLNLKEVITLVNTRFEENDGKSSSLNTIARISNKTTLDDYSKIIIDRVKKTRSMNYAKSIGEAVGLLLKFHGSNKLLLSEIDITFLRNLEAYYIANIQKGDSINGLGVYLRSIRMILNAAIADKSTELIKEDYPFGRYGYSIKRSATKKRAIDLDYIDKIKNYKLEEYSPLWHHQNYFLFSFYMRGMNFIDIAFLKMSAIQQGRLVYKRRKTKRGQNVKEFNIKINAAAYKILNYYVKDKSQGDLIFPIMADCIAIDDDEKLFKTYGERRSNHNRRLRSIAKALNIDVNLTSYVARHSFATAGLRNGATKAEIGDMLGHTNYYTTETYLSGFEQETLDDVADKIFNSTKK